MSTKYLLPCHDGQSVVVTTADAGRNVACPCGKMVTVPTLRGVQSLMRVDEPQSTSAAPAWSAKQGAMFTIGLCLLLVGLIALAMLYNDWRKINTTKPEMDPEFLAGMKVAVESAEAANTLDAWNFLKNSPMPEQRMEMPWEANRTAARKYLIYMSIAGAVAAIGLALAISGPLMRPQPPRRMAVGSRQPQKI
jgi:hypothetical protein